MGLGNGESSVMSIRCGLIAQPHRTGLGIQQMEFARHVHPEKVLVCDLAELHAKNSRNAKRVSTTNWFDHYPNRKVKGIPGELACKWLLEGIDLLFVVETPLNWEIFQWARERAVKTVLQANPEFFEYFERSVPKPDLVLLPTNWMKDEVAKFGIPTKVLPVPIATDVLEPREITTANQFVHIAGYPPYKDRNGTEIVKRAQNMSAHMIIHEQSKKELPNYADLYKQGDVLVLPRTYGGLSLQLQEAAAVGMPIIVNENDPYAGEPCTITVKSLPKQRLKLKAEVDYYPTHPQDLANVINQLHGTDISELSRKTREWANRRAWSTMGFSYLHEFKKLLGL